MSGNDHQPIGELSEPAGTAAQAVAPPVLQRLQQRLLQMPGVMNTQQLHRHYGQQQATTTRLMRRMDLPERIQSRYQPSGGRSQPFIPRFTGQRTEVSEAGGTGMVQRVSASQHWSSSESDSPHSTGQERQPISFAVEPSPLTRDSGTPGMASVSAQATVPAPTGMMATATSVVQAKPNSSPEAGNSVSLPDSPSILPSGSFRIRRQPVISDLPVVPVSVSPPHSGEPRASATIQRQPQMPLATSLPATSGESHPTSPDASAVQPHLPAESGVSAPITAASPLMATVTPVQHHSTEFVWRSPATPEEESVQPKMATYLVSPTPAIAPDPVKSLPSLPQKESRDGLTGADNPMGTPIKTVAKASTMQLKPQPLPLPLSWSLSRPMPIRQAGNETGKNGGMVLRYPRQTEAGISGNGLPGISTTITGIPGAIAPSSQSRPLYVPPINRVLIQRQESNMPSPESSAVDTGTPVSAMPPPPAPPSSTAAPEVDVAQIAEQVSRIILRRMTVERERRGLSR
ncbi:hypothetical protein J5X98_06335 [Leptothermofonsia sichuanensis E412]|uniref:hypothetical protein n=1 Tax=Leptothermofonsia sichuanensis TaxID=2917832 RepID=UPI001CA6A592|nr:hypothetical protein [Leptothermofonsia sichuanensis]QZZ22024.1 hypothetical protein J5X98_06335 [Leptothermofonsia sichuanensis E412]